MEAVFEFLCDRDEVGIKVFLISEQGVLMEVLLKLLLDEEGADFELHAFSSQ